MDQTKHTSPDLHALVDIFYDSISELGQVAEIDANSMPPVFRTLLDHSGHMTVTVERHHGCPVDVHVLQSDVTDTHYARRILLTRQSDSRVVQFGIVRLNLDYLGADVRREIESEQIPLGRVLIDHDVLRNVKLLSLWKIAPSDHLVELFALPEPMTCYGRTALIYCNGVIAVELIEIVTPQD